MHNNVIEFNKEFLEQSNDKGIDHYDADAIIEAALAMGSVLSIEEQTLIDGYLSGGDMDSYMTANNISVPELCSVVFSMLSKATCIIADTRICQTCNSEVPFQSKKQ